MFTKSMTLYLVAAIFAGTTAAISAKESELANGSRPALASSSISAISVASSFKNGDMLDKIFTADGADQSPPLNWRDLPKTAKSLAIMCFDPDAPHETFYHWLLYNLPASTSSLPEHIPNAKAIAGGAEQGINDFGVVGYRGPAPPPGKKHRYYFRVVALDKFLSLAAGSRKDQVLRAIDGHIVGQGEIIGYYSR